MGGCTSQSHGARKRRHGPFGIKDLSAERAVASLPAEMATAPRVRPARRTRTVAYQTAPRVPGWIARAPSEPAIRQAVRSGSARLGPGPLPLLAVPTAGSDGDRSGSPLSPRHAVRRSAQHQPQTKTGEARGRTGQYMDVSGWDGTRVTQNLDVEVARSAAGVSGRSQS